MNKRSILLIFVFLFLVLSINVNAELIYNFGTDSITNGGFSVINYGGLPISMKFNITNGTTYVNNVTFNIATKGGSGQDFNLTIVGSTGNLPNGVVYGTPVFYARNLNAGNYTAMPNATLNNGTYFLIFTAQNGSLGDFYRIGADNIGGPYNYSQCDVANLSGWGCSGTWSNTWLSQEKRYNVKISSGTPISGFFNFSSPSESGTTKYLPSNYILVNVTQNNILAFTNMTIYLYNSTGLYTNITTTNTTQFINFTVPFINETYQYNVTARNTTNQSMNSLTYTNYIRYATLNVTVLNYTGGVPSGFNYSLLDLSTLSVTSGSTSSNSTLINVVIGRTYNLTVFSSTLATTSTLVTITSSLTYVNITAYPYNSIRISSFLESDNSIVSVNASLLFFGSLSSFTRTLNGTNNTYFPINDDTYTITVTSGGYATRSYVVTVSNSSTQSLNIYMLSSNSTSIIGIYTKDLSDNILSNAVIQIQQLVNSTYLGIAQGLTDGNGFVTFSLQEGRTYRLIITADNFNIFQISFVPYLANSPYTFKLSPSSTFTFHTLTDYVSYSYSPIIQTLNQSNNTFTLTTYSANGSIIYTFINCSGRTQNVSGIPVGTTVSANLNVSEGQTVSCLYAFNVVEYGYYSFTVNYVRLTEYAQGIKASAKVIKNSTQQVWLTLLAYIILTLTAMGIKSRYPDIRITGVIFTVGTIVFVALEWINFIAGGVSATIGLLLLYMGSR